LEKGITLIVGLGNPGPQYDNNRHNVGFWLVKSLAAQYHSKLSLETKFKGFTGSIDIIGHKCCLLLPETFMNLSGEAVSRIVKFYKLTIDSILVVHDELDFLPGVVRLKKGGGANGHNGVQNIIDQLGDNNFWRMRIGIGKSEYKDNTSGYVLSAPSQAELEEIKNSILSGVTVIPKLILGDFSSVMTELHKL
jgi:peptidyl-tRNA hydrolase, PTH1 family